MGSRNTATGTCPCGCPPTTFCTATRRPGRWAGSPGCGSSRRTTRTSIAPKARSATSSSGSSGFWTGCTTRSGSSTRRSFPPAPRSASPMTPSGIASRVAAVEVGVVSVAGREVDYARKVRDELRGLGHRVELDERGMTLNAKIREAQLSKVPFTLVIGDKEVDQGAVSPRRYGGEDLKSMPLPEFEALLTKEAAMP